MAPRELPMFPLGTVLFPHAVLPLQVFEPRYRVMVDHLRTGVPEFGVTLIERGSEVGGGDVRFGLGTVARVVQLASSPDGRWFLTAVGTHRLEVEEWLPDDPYPRALVRDVADPPPSTDAAEARERVLARLAALFELWARSDPRAGVVEVALDDDPTVASYQAGALAPIGPLDAQRCLAAPDAHARLLLLDDLVAGEIDALRFRLGG